MLLFDAVELEYPRRTDVLLFAPQANVLFLGLVDGVALRFSIPKEGVARLRPLMNSRGGFVQRQAQNQGQMRLLVCYDR